MGILTRFDSDILVSYAHVDDQPLGGGKGAGWVTKFEQRLGQRLWRYHGSSAAIWRDADDLKGAEAFDTAIEQQLEKTGIVLALLSRPYMNSAYCQKELKWFDEAVRRSGLSKAGTQNRVFPVLLYNLSPKEWPESCQGLSGFHFHDSLADEIGDPLNPRKGEFQRSMKKLCHELLEALTALETASQPEGVEQEARPARGRVFLGHTADDRRSARKRIAKTLVEAGYHVLDPIPPPDDRVEHEVSVQRALEQADLAVHLLGEYAGRPFRDDEPEETYMLDQVRLGLDGSTSQLILLPDQLDPSEMEEPYYASFLSELEGLDRERGNLEIAKLSKAQMADVILARLSELAEVRAAVAAPAAETLAFVDIHSEDLGFLQPILNYFSERQITPITMPTSSNDPSAGLEYFRTTLKNATSYIAVYGNVAHDWVKQRALEARKLMAEEQRQMKMGIFLASPHDPAVEADFSPAYAVLDGSHGFDAAAFDRFLGVPGAVSA